LDSNRNKKVKCLFIGPLANHAVIGRVAALAAAGCDLSLVDGGDHRWNGEEYPAVGVMRKVGLRDPYYDSGISQARRHIAEMLRSIKILHESERTYKPLKNIVNDLDPDICVTHYGPISIHYTRIVRRSFAHLPIINIINVIPSALNFHKGLLRFFGGSSAKIEFVNYYIWLRDAAAIIVASDEMFEYITRKFGVNPERCYVLPDYLPRSFQGFKGVADVPRVERTDIEPRIIYLGAPERFGRHIDALDEHFLEIAHTRTHIYCATLGARVRSTGFGHTYPRFGNEEVFSGRLSRYAAQFDATLVVYNIPEKSERFRSTYPTRFFAAVACGLPIALRAENLNACERFLKEHGIGFTYRSADELRGKLLDTSLMIALKERAGKFKAQACAERQSGELRRIIERVLSNPRVKNVE